MMVARAEDGPVARTVHENFAKQSEAFSATFRDELEVAESIDMFRLTRTDWDAADVALVAIAYVASVYRFWAARNGPAGEAVIRDLDAEVQRALAALPEGGRTHQDGRLARIGDIGGELRAIHERAAAASPARMPDEIAFLCAQLLKPTSRHKAPNIALMPFLQIYVPERFCEILRVLDRQAGRTNRRRVTA